MSVSPIHERCRLLARTMNFAHALDAVHGGDPSRMVQAQDFAICAERGFTAIRLPIEFVRHLAGGGGAIDQQLLERVDWMLGEAAMHGLAIVLANHLDPELMAEPERYQNRLCFIWEELAGRYRNASEHVFLEPLSEPIENLCPVWNDVFARVLQRIREYCPERAVIVGPTHYNNMRFLRDLELPLADRNLIVSIHHYYPVEFTMQGEEWLQHGDPKSWLGTTFEANMRVQEVFAGAMDGIAAWAKQHDRPIFMAEFGTSSNADLDSRIAWTTLSRSLAEQRGFAWGCWAFSQTFELYDTEQKKWIEPLLTALLPQK